MEYFEVQNDSIMALDLESLKNLRTLIMFGITSADKLWLVQTLPKLRVITLQWEWKQDAKYERDLLKVLRDSGREIRLNGSEWWN